MLALFSPGETRLGILAAGLFVFLPFPLLVLGTLAALPATLCVALILRHRGRSHTLREGAIVAAMTVLGAVWAPLATLAFFLGAMPMPLWAAVSLGGVSGAAGGVVLARLRFG